MKSEELILCVDDDPLDREVLAYLLNDHYQTRSAASGKEAFQQALREPLPDLILLDLNLPDIDGYEVCRRLKRTPLLADIPVIFLSAAEAHDGVVQGLAAGGVDFVAKPVSSPILLARMNTHLHLRQTRRELIAQNLSLSSQVKQRTDALAQTRELTIAALGALAETRDNDTGNHIFRTQAYVRLLVEDLAQSRLGARIEAEGGGDIWKSAPLHDIGKIGIPDAILLKPGPLTEDEFRIMKTHARLGRDALLMAEARIKISHSFLQLAANIAGSHHERWDGRGYPEGLAGEAIPLAARLMAVADVYDAVISRRAYKSPASHGEAIDVIREGRGRHFDPSVADCFLEREAAIRAIALNFRDPVPGDVVEALALS